MNSKHVDSIQVLERETDFDVLQVQFSDGVDAIAFGKAEEYLEFVDKDVYVEFRMEMYHNIMRNVVVSFTQPSKIATVERARTKKLYTDEIDNMSNVCFKDMVEHEQYTSVVLYCVSHTYNSSPKATWAEYRVRDQLFRVKTLRVFDYDNRDADFTGQYITCDCTYDKYGLSSTRVTPLDLPYVVNPEVALATQFLTEYLAGDTELAQVCAAYDLLSMMQNYVDVERGYVVVEAATAISLCEEMANVVRASDVDLTAVKRALLLQYLYTTKRVQYSKPVSNIMLLLQQRISDRAKIVTCLDVNEVDTPERKLFKSINEMVATITDLKKGGRE